MLKVFKKISLKSDKISLIKIQINAKRFYAFGFALLMHKKVKNKLANFLIFCIKAPSVVDVMTSIKQTVIPKNTHVIMVPLIKFILFIACLKTVLRLML